MDSLYKESLISLYGEDIISQFINDNTSEELFEMYLDLLKSENRDSTKSMYAFENYLIKYYDTISNPEIKRKFDDIINKLYDAVDFNNITNVSSLSEASNFLKSTLTREDYITKFASSEKANNIRKTKSALLHYGNIISDKFNIYFNKKNSLIINGENYKENEELEKLSLTDKEKTLLLNFFSIYKPKNVDDKFSMIMEKYFVDLIADPYENKSSVMEKEFLVRYAIKNFFLREHNEMPEIAIVNDSDKENMGGYAQGKNFILINANSHLNATNLDIIHTACHENEHLVQKKAQYNDLAYYTMIRELPNRFVDKAEYDINYKYMEIELDAEKTSFMKMYAHLVPLFRKYNLDESKLIYRLDKMKENFNKSRPTFNGRKKLNGKLVPPYFYNIEMLKEIIGKNPIALSEYPISKEIFNTDGTIKNIEDVLFNKQKANMIIAEYIASELYLNNLKQVDLSNKNAEQIKNYWNNISDAFEIFSKSIRSFINNPDNLKRENGAASFIDLINCIGRFLTIINNNFESIINSELTPKLFYIIKSLISTYNNNIHIIEETIVNENIQSDYFEFIDVIFKKLEDINDAYDNYRFETELKIRNEYINNNDLLIVNTDIVEKIKQEIINSNADLLDYKFYLTSDIEISIESFLDNFVKQNLINGEILLKDYGKVPLNQFISYLNSEFKKTKEEEKDPNHQQKHKS